MKLAIREGMVPGQTLPEQLAWLERLGLDAIELHSGALDLPPNELRAIFAASPIEAAALEGRPVLVHPDPKERAAGKELTRERLHLAA